MGSLGQTPTIIYGLAEPYLGPMRYVGKTTAPLHRRIEEHYRKARSGHKSHKSNWLRSVFANNQRPTIHVLQVTTAFEADFSEKKWIRFFQERGFDLTNHTRGGAGSLGRKHSEESKAKMSKTLKGRIINEEWRRKLALIWTGRKHKPETIEKMRATALLRWSDPAERARQSLRTIKRYDDPVERKKTSEAVIAGKAKAKKRKCRQTSLLSE